MGSLRRATAESPYAALPDQPFAPLEMIDVLALAAICDDAWHNQELCRVNDCVVRLGVVEGECQWHQHARDDEFFFVISGRFIIDLKTESVVLGPRQGFLVPKGTLHRARAPERSIVLTFEGTGVKPTRD